MSFSETVPPAQNRSPDLNAEAEPHREPRAPTLLAQGAQELDSMLVPDPFASFFAEDPFPARKEPNPNDPIARGGTVFERYQRLFAAAESARDHEDAILAALDSVILGSPKGAPATGVRPTASPHEERTPHRPRLRSFHFERDVDWSEEPPQVFDRGLAPEERADSAKQSVPPSPAPLASEVPVVFDGALPGSAREPEVATLKRTPLRHELMSSSRGRWVAVALVIGFGLGFLMGRGDDKPSAARTPADAVATPPPPARAAVPLDSPAPMDLDTATLSVSPREVASPAPSLEVAPAAPPLAAPAQLASARPAPSPGGGSGFDKRAALVLLAKAGARAGVCVPPGEPGGSVVASVTFGRKGHVEDVALSSATFQGNYSSDCIKGVLSGVKVRPFFGDSVTVRKTLTVR